MKQVGTFATSKLKHAQLEISMIAKFGGCKVRESFTTGTKARGLCCTLFTVVLRMLIGDRTEVARTIYLTVHLLLCHIPP